ncbi:MAG: hypothetical protein GQ470_03875 [Gammaproteobacteria bacterium]|nr:hypothetical protein [Gammaproteobacteria bacterium]
MSSVQLSRLNQMTITQLIVATVVVKLLLVLLFPVTGDEAYFYTWGLNPALTFYDHPPLTGWFLTIVNTLLGWTEMPVLVLRLPAIIITTLAGLLIYRHITHYYNSEAALPITAIYLLLPLNLIAGFIYTTDTLLLLFSLLALLAIDRAHKDEKLTHYLIAGVWVGLAINTKYLSAIPATAIGLYLLFNLRRLGIKPLLLFVAATLPFVLFNLYINSQTCWTNITFNLYSRTQESSVGWLNPSLFVAQLLYLSAPLFIIYLRLIKKVKMSCFELPLIQIFFYSLLLFLLLSVFKSVGLHWFLGITLLIIFPIIVVDDVMILWRGVRYTLAFMLLHIVLLASVVIYINVGLDKELEYEADIYRAYYTPTHKEELQALIDQYDFDLLASNSYTFSSVIQFAIDRPVSVFGHGKPYGRQDDFTTDYRQFDGKDILIIFSRASYPELERYFAKFTTESPEFGGGKLHIALGSAFNYRLYLEEVLQPIAKRYYPGLPFTEAGSCPFNERYL